MTQTAPQPTAVQRVYAELLRLLQSTTGGRLPPIAELSCRFSASATTVSKAAHQLRDQGVLDFSRGRSMITSRSSYQPPGPRVLSEDRVVAAIEKRIRDGDFRHGEPLPKMGYFVQELSAANRTVARAYQKLVSMGLVHREGRQWFVGATTIRLSVIGTAPAVVVAQVLPVKWSNLASSGRTVPFCSEFQRETAKTGVRLVFANVQGESAASAMRPVHELASGLGQLYAGTLLLGSAQSIRECAPAITALLRLRRPVVWLDTVGSPASLENPYFATCRHSEQAAAEAAIQVLYRYGHRTAGYLVSGEASWIVQRREFIIKHSQMPGVPVRIITTPSYRDYVAAMDKDLLQRRLAALCRSAPGLEIAFDKVCRVRPPALPPRGYRDLVRHCRGDRFLVAVRMIELFRTSAFPVHELSKEYRNSRSLVVHSVLMSGLLADADVTAVIAPNDNMARTAYRWFQAAGLAVPDDLSLVSFDNGIEIQSTPISSVDFGFSSLGYSAFHEIMKTVPVAKDRAGTILARPWVAHRGSISSPPARPHRIQRFLTGCS